MPLDLVTAEPIETAEEWRARQRAERREQHASQVRLFQETLEKMAEEHRAALEQWLYDSSLAQVARYFDERKSGQSPSQWMKVPALESTLKKLKSETQKCWDTRWDDDRARERHREAEKAEREAEERLREASGHAKWLEDHIKGDKPDKPKLHAEAKADADQSLRQFIGKAAGKVFEFLIADTYTITKVIGRFHRGQIEGDILIAFGSGRSLRLNLFLRWMPLTYRPGKNLPGSFAQYPLYFRDVVPKKNAKPIGTVAENELYSLFGLEPWEPSRPAQKPRRVSTNDIIRMCDGRAALIVRIDRKKNQVKVWTPAGEAIITPEQIAEVLVVETHAPYDGVDWKLPDGRKVNLHPKLPPKSGYGSRDDEVRKAAFVQYDWIWGDSAFDPKKIKATLDARKAFLANNGKDKWPYSEDREEEARFLEDELTKRKG